MTRKLALPVALSMRTRSMAPRTARMPTLGHLRPLEGRAGGAGNA